LEAALTAAELRATLPDEEILFFFAK